MKGFRHILHASDLSGASRAAFATAVHIARTSGAELVLVHAFKMPLLADLYVSPKTYGAVEASGKAACMKRLTNLVTLARKRGVHCPPRRRKWRPAPRDPPAGRTDAR